MPGSRGRAPGGSPEGGALWASPVPFHDLLAGALAVVVVQVLVHALPHGGVPGLELEAVFRGLLQQGEQLVRGGGPVAEEVLFQVDVGPLGLVVLLHIELVEQHRLALVVHVPADAGVVGDQELALHHQLVQRLGAKGNQPHPVSGDGEVLDVLPELGVDVEVQIHVVLLQVGRQPVRVEQGHVVAIVVAGHEGLVGHLLQPVAPGGHHQNVGVGLAVRAVPQHVPTGQAGDDHLFGQIPQLVDDDVALLIVGGDEEADAVGAGAVKLDPLQGDYPVLEKHQPFILSHQGEDHALLGPPGIGVGLGVAGDQQPGRQNVDHVLQAHELDHVVFVGQQVLIVGLLFVDDKVDLPVHHRLHVVVHAVLEEVEAVVLGHTAVFLIGQTDALFQQRLPEQVIQHHGKAFLEPEPEAGVGGVLLADQGEAVPRRPVEEELVVPVQPGAFAEEQPFYAHLPADFPPVVALGAEGGLHRVPVLDPVPFKYHPDVPVQGGEGELFQLHAGGEQIIVPLPAQRLQREVVLCPVRLQLVPVGQHHAHPLAPLHRGTEYL